MRALRLVATLLLLTASMCAMEIAELRNGFTIPHRTRETRDGLVRLYIDDQKKSFVDIPAEEIESYSSEPDPPATPEPAKSAAQIVSEASARHGVDPDFIHSVIKQESAGNANAVSRTGARGLMQLMPGTAARLGVKNSFAAAQNVRGGTAYLDDLLKRYDNNLALALAAYNAGPGAVDKWHGIPPYPETRRYVARVIAEYNRRYEARLRAQRALPAVATAIHQ